VKEHSNRHTLAEKSWLHQRQGVHRRGERQTTVGHRPPEVFRNPRRAFTQTGLVLDRFGVPKSVEHTRPPNVGALCPRYLQSPTPLEAQAFRLSWRLMASSRCRHRCIFHSMIPLWIKRVKRSANAARPRKSRSTWCSTTITSGKRRTEPRPGQFASRGLQLHCGSETEGHSTTVLGWWLCSTRASRDYRAGGRMSWAGCQGIGPMARPPAQ